MCAVNTKREVNTLTFLDHELSIGNVCNCCLYSFPSEIEMTEKQEYFDKDVITLKRVSKQTEWTHCERDSKACPDRSRLRWVLCTYMFSYIFKIT